MGQKNKRKKEQIKSACVLGIMLKTCMSISLHSSFAMQRDGLVTRCQVEGA